MIMKEKHLSFLLQQRMFYFYDLGNNCEQKKFFSHEDYISHEHFGILP